MMKKLFLLSIYFCVIAGFFAQKTLGATPDSDFLGIPDCSNKSPYPILSLSVCPVGKQRDATCVKEAQEKYLKAREEAKWYYCLYNPNANLFKECHDAYKGCIALAVSKEDSIICTLNRELCFMTIYDSLHANPRYKKALEDYTLVVSDIIRAFENRCPCAEPPPLRNRWGGIIRDQHGNIKREPLRQKNSNRLSSLDTLSYSNNVTAAIYPNPTIAEKTITIQLNRLVSEEVHYTVVIYNLLGERVFSSANNTLSDNASFSVDISNLQQGSYLVSVKNTGDEVSSLIKLIVSE